MYLEADLSYALLGFRGHCYHFYVSDGQLKRDSADRMVTNHEEADTMVCFHARSVSDEGETENIVVQASYTDIAMILIYHSPTITATLSTDSSSRTKNKWRYINLTAIRAELGSDVRKSLLAFHAFAGCDYTSAFVKKGKVKPFAKLVKSRSPTCASKDHVGRECEQ